MGKPQPIDKKSTGNRNPNSLANLTARGRPKGVTNKATRDIKELAREHTPAAMVELARLAIHAESEAARVAAIKEMFDRAYGKPKQDVDLGGSVSDAIAALINRIDGRTRQVSA